MNNGWREDKTGRGMFRQMERDILEQSRRSPVPGRLGPEAAVTSDLNLAVENGYYKADSSTLNRPPGASYTWLVEAMNYSVTAGIQVARGVGTIQGVVYRRFMSGGAWGSWMVATVPPTSIAPTFGSGVTLGNGTASLSYEVADGLCFANLQFTLGSTSSVTGDFTLNQPSPLIAGQTAIHAGGARVTVGSLNADLHTIVFSTLLYCRTMSPVLAAGGTPAHVAQGNVGSVFTLATGNRVEAAWVYPTS